MPIKTPPVRSRRAPADFWIASLVGIGVLAAFGRIRGHQFILYDDPEYVVENLHVRAGLGLEGVRWAFTTGHSANWHPLTWLSHMLDCQLFGLNPGLHHLTSLLLHAANSVLLFWVLKRMTGARWPSAFAAALFALHPLHVESVAWVAERKDVLSTLFWLLALWAYARYAERPGGGRYGLSLALFLLGLMAKPMLVTLPFVLLLLDYWPLGRILGPARSTFVSLLVEKVPFLVLSAASSVVTFLVQRKWGAVASVAEIPWVDRLANAVVAYAAYLRKTIWPSDLAFFYPLPHERPLGQVALAALVMIGLSALVLRGSRRHPYLATGWGWYVVTLVPVIGLVQVGDQAMADRYTYVPSIGLFVIAAWGGAEVLGRRRLHSRALASLAAGLSLACGLATWFQAGTWKNSLTLFEHALRVTENNYLAHAGLGLALAESGRLDEAIAHYGEALRVNPFYSPAEASLGLALAQKGRVAEAIVHYRAALRLRPNRTEALNNLAWLLATSRDPKFRNGAEAVELAERAYTLTGRSNPNYLDTLAAAYAEAGRPDDAVRACEQAVALARAAGQDGLAGTIEERMQLYRAGQAYRER